MKKLLNKKVTLKTLIIMLFLSPILLLALALLIATIKGVLVGIMPDYYKDKMILKGYSKKENIVTETMFQDALYYDKYYYSKKDDTNFIKNERYKKIEDYDIQTLNNYIEKFENLTNIDVKSYGIKEISTNDYFYIEDRKIIDFTLYYYDSSSNILHVLIVT